MYCGRFAPSPTGPLHIGSLTCALASFLDARAAGGRWLVRIEDLDPPREKPGASADILRTLEDHGLVWDGEVTYQSRRHPLYEAALERLTHDGHAFRCTLSRTQLDAHGSNHPGRAISATLFHEALPDQTPPAKEEAPPDEPPGFTWRLDVPATDIHFLDRIQGAQHFNLAHDGGPFVIRRRDGLFAYQLAVVVDDAAQGITDVVRGSDLLDSTPRQLLLQTRLGVATPRYAHIPVLVDAQGQKLGKQARAAPVTAARRLANINLALRALGQPAQPDADTPAELLAAAVARWSSARIPRRMTIDLASLT